MASTIGIPPAPVLKALAENFTLVSIFSRVVLQTQATTAGHISSHVWFLHQETSLRRISEGLQLHRALLNDIVNHLDQKDQVLALQADIRDLNIQITKVCVCVCVCVRLLFLLGASKVDVYF